MQFPKFVKLSEKFITNNAPTILTTAAIIGTCATGYLSVRAGMEAKEKMIAESERRHQAANGGAYTYTKQDKFKTTWTEYLLPVGAGASTIACIFCANKITAARVATMTAAYSLSEGKLKDYKRALEEKLGVERKQEVDEHFAQQQAKNAVPVERQPQRPIIISGDEQLFFDVYSGRYFQATMQDLRSYENDLNYKVIQETTCPLSHFYELIGLPAIALGDDWGWDATCPPEFKYMPNIDDNSGKSCIWVEFEVEPLRGWNHLER